MLALLGMLCASCAMHHNMSYPCSSAGRAVALYAALRDAAVAKTAATVQVVAAVGPAAAILVQ
jgi:hypothetical protein